MLRRSLTSDERSALQARQVELNHAVAPHSESDVDRIMLAVLNMFAGYRSMRGDEAEAVANAEAVRGVLERFPAWAIERACLQIRENGVERRGQFDKQWPPSEPELLDVIRRQLALYQDTLANTTALLEAEVGP